MKLSIESFSIFPEGYNARYFIDNCLYGFGFIHKNGLPNGNYELGLIMNEHTDNHSRDFFYNQKINKITGMKDYYSMPAEDKEGYHKHKIIMAQYLIKPCMRFVIYPYGINNETTFELGDLVGVDNGKEVMVRARLNYLKLYPLLAGNLFNGTKVFLDLKL